MTKLYTKNATWLDEVLAGDERYDILEDGGGAFKADMQIALATAVTQAGTAVDASRMNNIDNGLDALDTRVENEATGWTDAQETWTYASAATFTISGDKTAKYQKGDKLKLTQTTAKYFYVLSVTYGAPNTTITVTGGIDYSVANAAITAPYYSKAANPQGFPGAFTFTPTFVSTSATFAYSTQFGKFSIHGNKCMFEMLITLNGAPGGTTTNTVSVQLPVTNAGGGTVTLPVYWNIVTLPANMTFLVGLIATGASVATLRYTGSGQTAGLLLASGLGSNAQIGMSGQFLI